jgi:DNA-binding transcriptional MerR regulator
MPFTPKKLYYKIGEVCEIVDVKAYVLRYWESEFPMLLPPKNKSGQRTYRPKDIEILLQIRKLLYEDGFTIAGARKHLASETSETTHALSPKAAPKRNPPKMPVSKDVPSSKRLRQVREELENILTLLERE